METQGGTYEDKGKAWSNIATSERTPGVTRSYKR